MAKTAPLQVSRVDVCFNSPIFEKAQTLAPQTNNGAVAAVPKVRCATSRIDVAHSMLLGTSVAEKRVAGGGRQMPAVDRREAEGRAAET